MDLHTHEHDSFPRATDDPAHALSIITAIVVAAGFAMVVAWFALLLLDDRRNAPVERSASKCNICGVVERVSEIPPAPMQPLEGSRAEGAVILLAALGGAPAPGGAQPKIFETSVLHDDGYVRVLRNGSVPQWALGDRVKVVKGRVEPVASPAGRTPTPGLRAAQAP
jgi:hypothetical protein